MSNNIRRLEGGFTLLELIVVIALLGLVSSLATDFMVSETNQQRYETTQQRMEKIRYAIIGDVSRTLNGQPVFSGFVADMGATPTFLTQLTQKEFCSDGEGSNESGCTAGTGTWKTQNANWKGPYLSSTDLKDGWGNSFTYSNPAGEEISSGDDMVITSLGLDKGLGITSTELDNITYEADQNLIIPASNYAGKPFNIDIDINTSGIPDEQFCLYTSKPGLASEIDLNINTIRPIPFTPDTFGGVTVTVFKKIGAATTNCDSTEATGFSYTANYIYAHNLIDVAIPEISVKLLPVP